MGKRIVVFEDGYDTILNKWSTRLLHFVGCRVVKMPYQAGGFKNERAARKFVKDRSTAAQTASLAADLLEACESLTSYTMDLLYKLDDQVYLGDVEEIQQARAAIEKYNSTPMSITTLREICRLGLQFLDTLPDTELTTETENRNWFRKKLRDTLEENTLGIDDSCPRCGAGNDERELLEKEFIGIEAIHMHYLCKKCGVRMIEEFKLADVFVDDRTN